MIKILDKYIFTQLIGPFIFGFFLFVTIIAIDPLISALQSVINESVSMEVMFRWFLNRLPQDMMFTFPMSVLLSTLLVFGRMSKDSETVALRSGGTNFYRILVPVMVFAMIVTIVSLIFNDKIVPYSNERARIIRRREILKINEPETTENSVMRASDGAFIYARYVYESRKLMERVLVEYYTDDGDLTKRITAAVAKWEENMWVLEAAVVHEYKDDKMIGNPQTYAKLLLEGVKEGPAEFARQSKRPVEMSYDELKERIDTYERTKFMDTTELRVELAMKISLPLASIFFAIIGASFGLTNSRSGAFIGFGVSIFIIFAYYIIMSISTSLGKTGILPAEFSAWLQNIIFAFAGLFIVRKINK